MNHDMQRVVILLPDDLAQDFKDECDKAYDTMSNVGRRLIAEWVQERQSKGSEKNIPPQVNPKVREQILTRDGETCQYCGVEDYQGRMMVDHIVPLSMGGFAAPFNLTAACGSCNSKKRGCIWIPNNFDEISTNYVWKQYILNHATEPPQLYRAALEFNISARVTEEQYKFLESFPFGIPDALRRIIDEAIEARAQMSVAECARRMHVHEDTIRKAIKRGDLPAVKFGRQWAINEDDFAEFMDNPPRMGRPPKDD